MVVFESQGAPMLNIAWYKTQGSFLSVELEDREDRLFCLSLLNSNSIGSAKKKRMVFFQVNEPNKLYTFFGFSIIMILSYFNSY